MKAREASDLDPERIRLLADAVFGVAMTILAVVLFLEEDNTLDALKNPWYLSTYVVSFGILGIFWVAHTHHFKHIKRSNRSHHWINLGFLAIIGLIPVATAALGHELTRVLPTIGISCLWGVATAEVGHELSLDRLQALPLSALIYGVVLLFAVLMLYSNWWYATSARRYGEEAVAENLIDIKNTPNEEVTRLYGRLFFAAGLYLPPLLLCSWAMWSADADSGCKVIWSLLFYASHPLWAITPQGRNFVDCLTSFIPASWYWTEPPPSVH